MKRNKEKKGIKKGFTIIEVILFLAISGALFAMIMVNTSTRVASRRYFDAVNDIVEELRNAYSATINVENYRHDTEDSGYFCSITSAFEGSTLTKNSEDDPAADKKTDNYPGRTRCAVYGRVITFGEDNKTIVHQYDLIGLVKTDNLEPEGDDDVLLAIGDGTSYDGSLAGVKANIVTIRNTSASTSVCRPSLAGTYTEYKPQWDAKIENKGNRGLYYGAIMIARSPLSGTIHTYIYDKSDDDGYDDVFAVQEWIKNTPQKTCASFDNQANTFVKKAIDNNKWIKQEASGDEAYIDVCIGSDDLFAVGNKRRAIRIHGDGSTEAAVELLSEVESNDKDVCGKGNDK